METIMIVEDDPKIAEYLAQMLKKYRYQVVKVTDFEQVLETFQTVDPQLVALIHGAVALTALSHFFDYNLITESALVLGGFTVIQLLYFVLARHFYIKQVKRIL